MPRLIQNLSFALYGLIVLAAILPTCRDASVPGHGQSAQNPSVHTIDDWPYPIDAPARPKTRKPLDEQLVGFALNVHHVQDASWFFPAIDQMQAMGANAVEIITPAYQENAASNTIVIDSRRCPDPEQLRRVIFYAKAKGLHVSLMPIVLFSYPRGNEWRGKIRPDDWDKWWSNYEKFICGFAVLAEQTGCDTFSVGSELLSTERMTDRWSRIIQQVRQRYSGKLVYSTNWDHYHVPTFWDQVDMIGINGYWTIGRSVDTPMPGLVQAWSDVRRQVLTFAKIKKRPVLFTEIGYPSLPWATRDPWNYIANGARADTQAQLRGLTAFTRAWDENLGPARPVVTENPLAGTYIYEWDMNPGGPDDTSYGIKGKPAFQYMANWFKQRQRQ